QKTGLYHLRLQCWMDRSHRRFGHGLQILTSVPQKLAVRDHACLFLRARTTGRSLSAASAGNQKTANVPFQASSHLSHRLQWHESGGLVTTVRYNSAPVWDKPPRL